MKLQTSMTLGPGDRKIDYHSRLLLLGSCFVEHMGEKLDHFKFQGLRNPFGILFHPLALEKLLYRAVEGLAYESGEVFGQQGSWGCFDAHSQIAAKSREDLLGLLDQRLLDTRSALGEATHLILTLGTAWVYVHRASGRTVANCHKVPQREFDKKLLSVSEIADSLQRILALLDRVNPDCQIILTISPVRHLRDGFVENQRSKAHLIGALHQVLDTLPNRIGAAYFPAYELMMDELRDYRFYARDMVHPNELAIDYIWERFRSVWISSDCESLMQQVDQVQKDLAHRAFDPDSEGHKKFMASLREKIAYLQGAYPFMKFD